MEQKDRLPIWAILLIFAVVWIIADALIRAFPGI